MSAAGRMVPGVSEAALEREHVERYRFACNFAHGKKVLDAACGVGYAGPMFLAAGARSYLGIDLNAEAVELAKRAHQAAHISFAVDDACEFRSVPEQVFDLVVSFETIEHVPSAEKFLANVRRALRPGGTFIVSTPNRWRYSPGNKLSSKPWNPYHVREWNENEFLDLLKPWFRVADVLGQKPISSWKAQVIDLAGTRPWLKTLIATLRASKKSTGTAASAVAVDDAFIPGRVSRWQVPLFTICVAQARGEIHHGTRQPP
jgi:SAM-dependent methyltransferase